MTDIISISSNPGIKCYVESTEQIDIDLSKWKNYDVNICPQCGQDHSYKLKAGNTSLDIISLFDKNSSVEV